MGNRFAITGTVRLSSTGKSLVLEIVNRNGKDYVGIEDIQNVVLGYKKYATVWRPRPRYR